MSNKMDPLRGDGTITYENTRNGSFTTGVNHMRMVMHQNLLFDKDEIKWYSHFNRYGYIDPYNTDQVLKEFLFFTKPDLYIFDGDRINGSKISLNPSLSIIPFFSEAAYRHPQALAQLQYGIKDDNGVYNPFMALLSNSVTSKLDLPAIQSEFNQSTPNIYGTTIDYRSHSIKSDNAFDFTLSFLDTAYLEIYTMVKAYDEYMRLQKLGDIEYNDKYKQYIIDRIIPEQFSVYKFLIGSDGETILYYAKATGVFFTDVPRSDFSDPGNDGFKYSLSFHANFIEDNNPMILNEFNLITPASSKGPYIDVYNSQGVNNSWARYPRIVKAEEIYDRRVSRRGTHRDYRLKWTDADNPTEDNVSYNSIRGTGGYNNGSSYSSSNNKNGGNGSVVYMNNKNYYNSGLRVNPKGQAGNLLYEWVNGNINTSNPKFQLFTS